MCSGKNPQLQRIVKVDFHEHKLHRHVINNQNQWTCHTSSKKFKEWVESTNDPTIEKNVVCKCNIVDIISNEDQTKLQGYECRDCDFDICLECLLCYKDKKRYEIMQNQKRDDFRNDLQDYDLKDIRIDDSQEYEYYNQSSDKSSEDSSLSSENSLSGSQSEEEEEAKN